MFKSIQLRIVVIILSVNLVILGLIVGVSYTLSTNTVETQIHKRLETETLRVASQLNGFFSQVIQIGQNLAVLEEQSIDSADHKKIIEKTMKSIAEDIDYISSISFTYSKEYAEKLIDHDHLMIAAAMLDGVNTEVVPYDVFNFPDSPQYNPNEFSFDYFNTESPVFADFNKYRTAGWAKVIYEKVQDLFILSYWIPAYDNEGKLISLCSVDINLDKMNQIIRDLNYR